jgi:hypothetical protein
MPPAVTPQRKRGKSFISLEKTPLKPICMNESEKVLLSLLEAIAKGKCSREMLMDWLIAYEEETGDTSLRRLADLDEGYIGCIA